ncbi:MAG: membrane dipeptidase, partial [Lachnospiraceae bacterium]|nr:membrane dipeptidase [Lachnospiraceae bacterium]
KDRPMLPFIDLHCDTLYRTVSYPERFFASGAAVSTHVFHSGLLESRCTLQCFAFFTDLCESHDQPPLSSVQKQYDCFRHILSKAEKSMMQIKTRSDLAACLRQNKTGALLTLEESCLGSEPAALLSDLYSLGVRIATLTWDYSTILAGSAANAAPSPEGFASAYTAPLLKSATADTGLTPHGFSFLEEAEHLGIIIDVSHLSDRGFFDVATHSKKPFLASHSNARSVRDVPRNLSDDMLRILGNRGGLTGLCFHEPFLASSPCSAGNISEALIRHVKHILSIAGSDILALGTDFDGTPGNRIIPDVTKLFRLEDLLKKAGLTGSQIEKIFYKNALRFFRENLP